MKLKSKLTSATIGVVIVIMFLLLLLQQNKVQISKQAESLAHQQTTLLATTISLNDIVGHEMLSTHELIITGDLDAFEQQHHRYHTEYDKLIAILRDKNINHDILDQIETNSIDFHNTMHQIGHLISDNQGDYEPLALTTLMADLQLPVAQLNNLVQQLTLNINEQINQSRLEIEDRSQTMVQVAIFLGLGMLGLILVLFLNTKHLHKANEKQRSLSYYSERSPDCVLTVDINGKVVYANPRAYSVLKELRLSQDEIQRLLPVSINGIIKELQSGASNVSRWSHHVNGVTFESSLQWLREFNQGHIYLHDITKAESLQKRLNYLAYFDPLTKLPNRRRFEEEIENIIALNKYGSPQAWSIALIRINRFAKVTTGHGYNVGDKLLSACATRLRSALHDFHDAHVFRFDGARFGLLAPESQTHQIADHLNLTMQQPIFVDGNSFYLSLSIGYTVTPGANDDVTKLIIDAGAALERATNAEGTFLLCEFTDDIRTKELQWLNMEVTLRDALRDGELELFYQPQVNTNSGELVGMETLIRWRQADGSYISPADFIPLAERIGLSVALDEWVLHKAFQQAANWENEYNKQCVVAVNISSKQFSHNHLINMLHNALDSSGVNPELIEIELTETAMLENIENVLRIIKEIKELGMSVSIDDFGTGYSSMSYLKDLPVDKIKIDKAFIEGISAASNLATNKDKAIVASIVELGHNLQLEVIAEGVENSEQIEFLNQVGCDILQGYIISTPRPPEELRPLFSGRPLATTLYVV